MSVESIQTFLDRKKAKPKFEFDEFERMKNDFEWTDVSIHDYNGTKGFGNVMGNAGLTFNYSGLSRKLLVFEGQQKEYTELIRLKSKKSFNFDDFVNAIKYAKGE